jgi:hypothetical protein
MKLYTPMKGKERKNGNVEEPEIGKYRTNCD